MEKETGTTSLISDVGTTPPGRYQIILGERKGGNVLKKKTTSSCGFTETRGPMNLPSNK